MFSTLFKYELRNMFRNKWVFGYALFFLLLTESLYQFNPDSSKVFISLMNVILIAIPLVSIIYGTQFVYNSREFIQVLISQPLNRKIIFFSSYLASVTAISGSFILGTGVPLFVHEWHGELLYAVYVLLSGGMLSGAYISIAFLIAYKFDDKGKGLGLSLIVWFFLSILYDGIFMLIMFLLRDYPVEYPALVLSIFNPNDLARLILTLNLDVSALMGYTGAVYKDFLGSAAGIIISVITLLIWQAIPLLISLRVFIRKDF